MVADGRSLYDAYRIKWLDETADWFATRIP